MPNHSSQAAEASPQPAGETATLLQQIVAKYIYIRDLRAQAKKEYEEDDALNKRKMELVENALRDHMRVNGMSSMKIDGNTVYTEDVEKPMVEDWPAFAAFILEQGDIGFLQKRISEGSFKQYKTETGQNPPGVTTSTFREVRIRRANQKD